MKVNNIYVRTIEEGRRPDIALETRSFKKAWEGARNIIWMYRRHFNLPDDFSEEVEDIKALDGVECHDVAGYYYIDLYI